MAAYDLSGKSRQPLLDACRQLKPLLHDPTVRAGLFREGRDCFPHRSRRARECHTSGPGKLPPGESHGACPTAPGQRWPIEQLIDPRSLSTLARLQFRFQLGALKPRQSSCATRVILQSEVLQATITTGCGKTKWLGMVATVANSSAARRMNLFIVGLHRKVLSLCMLSWFTDHADLMRHRLAGHHGAGPCPAAA